MHPKSIALLAKEACEEKKGIDVVILDLRGLSSICDFFVIASGTSDRHVAALADNIQFRLDEKKVDVGHIEGLRDARWVLIDCGSVIAHVFYKETRFYYGLERLWGDAPRVL